MPIACIRSAARPTVRYFMPLMSFGAGDRLLEPAERLGRHRHGEEALDVELHDLDLELFEQLLAAAVVDPAEAFVGVEAEHRAGAEQRGGLVLAVPVHGHGMGGVDLAAVHAVEHLERMHHRAAVQHVDLEPAARHLVDARDVLLAISVKMSVAGHEVCMRSVAVWARETCGIATAAAPVMAAPARNLRRVVVLDCELISVFPPCVGCFGRHSRRISNEPPAAAPYSAGIEG